MTRRQGSSAPGPHFFQLSIAASSSPAPVLAKVNIAKQAADLHTAIFNQRVVYEVIRTGLLEAHVPTIRARYKLQRDAMDAALHEHLAGLAQWQRPVGGMFFWLELPAGLDAMALLPRAVEAGMAFVPGEPFFAAAPMRNTLRLSFVTVATDQIELGIAALARVLRQAEAAL